jgi:hypothetical protein
VIETGKTSQNRSRKMQRLADVDRVPKIFSGNISNGSKSILSPIGGRVSSPEIETMI